MREQIELLKNHAGGASRFVDIAVAVGEFYSRHKYLAACGLLEQIDTT